MRLEAEIERGLNAPAICDAARLDPRFDEREELLAHSCAPVTVARLRRRREHCEQLFDVVISLAEKSGEGGSEHQAERADRERVGRKVWVLPREARQDIRRLDRHHVRRRLRVRVDVRLLRIDRGIELEK